jgi:hypothetical protein
MIDDCLSASLIRYVANPANSMKRKRLEDLQVPPPKRPADCGKGKGAWGKGAAVGTAGGAGGGDKGGGKKGGGKGGGKGGWPGDGGSGGGWQGDGGGGSQGGGGGGWQGGGGGGWQGGGGGGWQGVGGYAIQPKWADGHSTGIYSYKYLRRLTKFVP